MPGSRRTGSRVGVYRPRRRNTVDVETVDPAPRPPGPLLRWPVPALVVWLAAFGVAAGGRAAGLAPVWVFAGACAVGLAGSLLGTTALRRLVIAAGYPAAMVVLGFGATLPAWAWLLPLAGLLLLYPVRTWSDAPLFPTPPDALDGLRSLAPLALGSDVFRGTPRILDAGCGVGDGLLALRRAYPEAAIEGVEWSWPLWLACRLRCRWAVVRRGDLWKTPWSGYDLVYLFQRPESMPRAVDKAMREMRPGAWLVSLEFEAPGLRPVATLQSPGGRRAWIYRPGVFAATAGTGRRPFADPVPSALDTAGFAYSVVDVEPLATMPGALWPGARPGVGSRF